MYRFYACVFLQCENDCEWEIFMMIISTYIKLTYRFCLDLFEHSSSIPEVFFWNETHSVLNVFILVVLWANNFYCQFLFFLFFLQKFTRFLQCLQKDFKFSQFFMLVCYKLVNKMILYSIHGLCWQCCWYAFNSLFHFFIFFLYVITEMFQMKIPTV
jgi:hypothetical protein